MIKNYCIKVLSSVFIMLTIFMVSSSVFASSTETITYGKFEIVIDKTNSTVTATNTESGLSQVFTLAGDVSGYSNFVVTYSDYVEHTSLYNEFNSFSILFFNSYDWTTYSYTYGTYKILSTTDGFYLPFNNKISTSNNEQFGVPFGTVSSSGMVVDALSDLNARGVYAFSINSAGELNRNTSIVYSTINITNPYDSNNNIFESVVPTTFDYDFVGVNRDKVELVISNLDESYRFYGLVGYNSDFSVGDIFYANDYINYLRVIDALGSCSGFLSLGEVVDYVIVDDTDTIVNVGIIDNMANGYLLWAYEYQNGVDFAFIIDGAHYWSDDLDFIWSGNNGIEYTDDQVITIIPKVVEVDSDIYSTTINGRVEDSSGDILGQDELTVYKDQSSFKFEFIDLSYYESKLGVNMANFVVNGIRLSGFDNQGNNVDWSDYYVKWNVNTVLLKYAVSSECLYINDSEYTTLTGMFENFANSGNYGICNFNMRVVKRLNDYTPFNITFYIYNGNNELVHTEILSSDSIVKHQISIDSSIGNGSNNDYDITDNPNYNSGPSYDINDITNWDAEDYIKLLNTDNFVWEFFKAILGNLPWWITVPLTILIFGVVIITLIRFARGA